MSAPRWAWRTVPHAAQPKPIATCLWLDPTGRSPIAQYRSARSTRRRIRNWVRPLRRLCPRRAVNGSTDEHDHEHEYDDDYGLQPSGFADAHWLIQTAGA